MNDSATLVGLVARAAAARARHDAVVTRQHRLTYEALWTAVTRGASALAARGIARGDRVALLAPATTDSVAACYAILAAGAVVVPLDPEATVFELAARIAHCAPALVMAPDVAHAAAAVARTPACDTPVVTPQDALSGPAAANAPPCPDAGDLAAILYTSGTTDEPKGVMLTHANLAANVLAVVEYLGLGPNDRVLSPLPLFYAYGSSVLHTHLVVGGTVVLADMVYAQRTVDRMAEERVTGFSGVAWMYSTLLDRTSFPTRPLPALRYLTQAGSRLPPAEIARIVRARPGVAFFVMYGQTEATSRLTYLEPAELPRRVGSVGRPIAGSRIEIRRPDGSAASPGEYGEVVAAGPGIMAGYWRAPDQTAAAVTCDERGRWLRTGDRGCLDDDGFLYLDGRLSEMIKVGGHRVSPGEVEDVARLMPGVAHAVAVAAPDPVLGEVVHLVIVRAPGAAVTAPELLTHCRTHLSAYKTPRHVTFTDALPRTASGKIQRARLGHALEAT